MSHHKCKQNRASRKGLARGAEPCPTITNADRVAALRKMLGAVKALMGNLRMDYFLYGGSAVGQYRCGDVLPWDGDNDIVVPRKDLQALHQKVFGRPWKDLGANKSSGMPWESRGYNEWSG